MKIQILSDLHNEFGESEYDFSNIDLLILAGDIFIGEKGFHWIANKVKDIPVLYVLGNHEYYKNTYPKLIFELRELSKSTNIHILEKESIVINGISFHGLTLWTNFELFGNPKNTGYECQQKMNDYVQIRIQPDYSKLKSIDTHVIHYESLKWLENSLLNSSTQKNVVISHHAPSIKSIPEKERNDIISAAYASDLENFINTYKPDVWIHGHIHESLDYFVSQTRIICNPKGYIFEPNENFNPKFVIEIDA